MRQRLCVEVDLGVFSFGTVKSEGAEEGEISRSWVRWIWRGTGRRSQRFRSNSNFLVWVEALKLGLAHNWIASVGL